MLSSWTGVPDGLAFWAGFGFEGVTVGGAAGLGCSGARSTGRSVGAAGFGLGGSAAGCAAGLGGSAVRSTGRPVVLGCDMRPCEPDCGVAGSLGPDLPP